MQKVTYKTLLPKLLSMVTGVHRQKMDIEWSSESWVHNIFRAYEVVFWRREGIRREATTIANRDKKGRVTVYHKFYTVEAVLAHFEGVVRAWVKARKFSFEWVEVPQFAYVGMNARGIGFKPIMVLAIAHDATSSTWANSATNPLTVSHTCTGSNLMLALFDYSENHASDETAATYNSVAMSKQTTLDFSGNGAYEHTWGLLAPATGAHTLSNGSTTGGSHAIIGSSYTGVKQSGLPDSAPTPTSSNSGQTLTLNFTTIADNAWIFGGGYGPSSYTASTGTTLLVDVSGFTSIGAVDTNGALTPAGAHSVSAGSSNASQHVSFSAFSFAPFVAAAVNSRFLVFM